MNIFVDPSLISEVLLQDGWHVVVPGTLAMGKYALVEPNMPSPASAGFTFHEAGGASIAGPMTSILAVRHRQAARTTEVYEAPAVQPPAPRAPAPRPPVARTPAPGPARPPAGSPAPASPPVSKPQPASDPDPPGSLPRDWWEP